MIVVGLQSMSIRHDLLDSIRGCARGKPVEASRAIGPRDRHISVRKDAIWIQRWIGVLQVSRPVRRNRSHLRNVTVVLPSSCLGTRHRSLPQSRHAYARAVLVLLRPRCRELQLGCPLVPRPIRWDDMRSRPVAYKNAARFGARFWRSRLRRFLLSDRRAVDSYDPQLGR